jgi:hypothetical protein
MSDPVPPLPSPLVFAYRPGEPSHFSVLAGNSLQRTLPWYSFWIVLFGMFFVIGIAVLGAQKWGRISAAEVPAVLFAAYVAYGCGAALSALLIFRRLRQIVNAAEEIAGITWEVTFSDAGTVWTSEILETRVSWRAIKSVEAWRDDVLIWLVQRRCLVVPSRVFADAAARRTFIAAVQGQIDRASGAVS